MLENLLGRPTAVLLAALTAVILGGVSLASLPVSLLPRVERPQLIAVLEAPDRSREDLLVRFVEPLERRFRSLDGVLAVHSTIDDGLARLQVDTEWQTDADQLRIEAERVRTDLGEPVDLALAVQTGDPLPVLEIAILGGSAHDRTEFADRTLIPELARLSGAGEIRRQGGKKARVVVKPLGAALVARGLTVTDLVDRLRRVGVTTPAGFVEEGGVTQPLLVQERIVSLEQLARIGVGPDEAIPLSDVATLRVDEIGDRGVVRVDGQDAVLVQLYRAPDANAVLLSRAAYKSLEQQRLRNSGAFELRVVRDTSREVTNALGQLSWAAVLGLLLGAVVLRFMLGSFRPTLSLALVVPASILTCFGAFLVWDVSIDVISLAGLVLALGMLVDNAIVVLDAINSRTDDSWRERVHRGTSQISMALVASFATTAAVFVPLLYLKGLARAFFGVQAFAIVSSILISLVFSLTVTPVLALLGGRGGGLNDRVGRQPLRRIYLDLLARCLERPALPAIVLITLASLTITLGLLYLPRQLTSRADQASDQIEVGFELSGELSQRGQEAAILDLERIVLSSADEAVEPTASSAPSLPLLRYFEPRLSDPTDPLETSGILRASVGTSLDEMATTLSTVPGLRYSIHRSRGALDSVFDGQDDAQSRISRLSFATPGSTTDNRQVEVRALTRVQAQALADRVVAVLDDNGVESRIPEPKRRSAWMIDWLETRTTRLGTKPQALETALTDALGDFYVGQASISGLAPEIYLEAAHPSDPHLLPVLRKSQYEPGDPAGRGKEGAVRTLLLGALAQLETNDRPTAWYRRDGNPTVMVELTSDKGSTEDAQERIDEQTLKRILDRVPRNAGETITATGQAWEIERAFSQLRLAMSLALILVFLCVAGLYESFLLPVTIIATIPVALGGALSALLLTGQSINVVSFLGLILLAGIVVNNSIVLVHRTEQLRGEVPSRSVAGSILEAARERYRPILMTTLTTVLGVLPLAVLGGEAAGLRRSLAIAVCGGLSAGLLGSLLLVPLLYQLFLGGKDRA